MLSLLPIFSASSVKPLCSRVSVKASQRNFTTNPLPSNQQSTKIHFFHSPAHTSQLYVHSSHEMTIKRGVGKHKKVHADEPPSDEVVEELKKYDATMYLYRGRRNPLMKELARKYNLTNNAMNRWFSQRYKKLQGTYPF